MDGSPSIIVKRRGFLATLVGGLFGFLITVVLCATGLGVYALHIADGRINNVVQIADTVVDQLGQWRDVAPPFVAEAFDDHRADGYSRQVKVDVSLDSDSARDGRQRVVFRVTNDGDRDISLLALNVVLKDDRGTPIEDFRSFVATPLPLDAGDWRGPLNAGNTREFSRMVRVSGRDLAASAEVCELRVFEPSAAGDAKPTELAKRP